MRPLLLYISTWALSSSSIYPIQERTKYTLLLLICCFSCIPVSLLTSYQLANAHVMRRKQAELCAHVCARCNCNCSVNQPIIHGHLMSQQHQLLTSYLCVPAVSRPRRVVEALPAFAFPAAISTSPPSWAPPSGRPSAAIGFPPPARRKQRKMRTKYRSAYIMLAAHTTSSSREHV